MAPSNSMTLLRLVASGGVVIVAGYPWGLMVWHSHWSRVQWVPFYGSVRLLDAVANVLLCAPLGIAAGLSFKRGVVAAAFIALALSVFVEVMQVYSHSRVPSATDVVCNVAGAVVAAALLRRLRPQRTMPS